VTVGAPAPGDSAGAVLTAALRAHGAAAATEHIIRTGDVLRVLTRETSDEYLATFDVESGQAVGETVRGEGGEVDARSHLRALRPDRRYVSVHTHTRSTSFSVGDAIILTRTPALVAIAVVGVDGTWYLLSKQSAVGEADHLDVALAFTAALRALQPQFRDLLAAGAVSALQADRELLHTLWKVIAPPLGLRYDRTVNGHD